MGSGRSRRASHGRVRHAVARGHHRSGQAHEGGYQGPHHHAGGNRVPQRERGPAQGARPVRVPAPRAVHPRSGRTLRRRGPRHRARELRGPVRGHRVRRGVGSRAQAHRVLRGGGRGLHPPRLRHFHQARLGDGVRSHRALRVRVRAQARALARDGGAQGQHHEALRRPVPARRARGGGGVRGRGGVRSTRAA